MEGRSLVAAVASGYTVVPGTDIDDRWTAHSGPVHWPSGSARCFASLGHFLTNISLSLSVIKTLKELTTFFLTLTLTLNSQINIYWQLFTLK